jgi:hypothetical protein
MLIGFRFDRICEILRYDKEYVQEVWSHFSCSATYREPNCAKEVHEHTIAPVDKWVSSKRNACNSPSDSSPRSKRMCIAIRENDGGSGGGGEYGEVEGVGIRVDGLVGLTGIPNPHYQQEVSNQLSAADVPISDMSSKGHHVGVGARDPPAQQVSGLLKQGTDDLSISMVEKFLLPFCPEDEQRDLGYFLPDHYDPSLFSSVEHHDPSLFLPVEHHDPSLFLPVEHHDPSLFLPVEHHDPSQFLLVESHDRSQFINPADCSY